MTAAFITVPIPANKIRRNDLIQRDGAEPEKVVTVDGFPFPAVTIRTESGAFVADPYDEIPVWISVGRPAELVGLYKADGSGVFHCICVYRVVDTSLASESVAEDPKCPTHGSDRLDDDEWD